MSRWALAIAVLWAGTWTGLLGGMPRAATAQAQEASEAAELDLDELREERERRRLRHSVGRRISRYLSAAAEKLDEEKPDEAIELLQRLRLDRLNPLERALVYRMMAYVSYTSEDFPGAIGYFEKVLGEEILPISDEARLRFNVAQLYASLQEWRKVIEWLENWLQYVDVPNPLGFYMMGIAHYQLEEYDAAIAQALRAVKATDQPKEAWLRLLAALYSRERDYEKATPVLEELVLRYPKKSYWVQLSLIYGAKEDYMESLAVQQVAYAQGLLTEDDELRRLARSYLYHDLPYPAAKVLEKGLESGRIEKDPEALELLANSWVAAREYDRSLAPLREAARLAETGNMYVRLGQVHMQREEWEEAVQELQKAVEKGGLEDPGNVALLLGISYYNSERLASARSSFARARNYESTRKEANRWITHIQSESEKG